MYLNNCQIHAIIALGRSKAQSVGYRVAHTRLDVTSYPLLNFISEILVITMCPRPNVFVRFPVYFSGQVVGVVARPAPVFVVQFSEYNNTACEGHRSINGRRDNNFAPGYQREHYLCVYLGSVCVWLVAGVEEEGCSPDAKLNSSGPTVYSQSGNSRPPLHPLCERHP